MQICGVPARKKTAGRLRVEDGGIPERLEKIRAIVQMLYIVSKPGVTASHGSASYYVGPRNPRQ